MGTAILAHRKALCAHNHVHGGAALLVHQVFAKYRAVVLTETGTENRKGVAATSFERVQHGVYELDVLAHPVSAIEEQRRSRFIVVAVQPAILVEGNGIRSSGAIHAILGQRQWRPVSVVGSPDLIAQESEQVIQVGGAAVVEVLEGCLRQNWGSGRTPLEDRVARRLPRARDQGDAQVSTCIFETREAFAHRLVPSKEADQREGSVRQGLAQKSLEGVFILEQRERIERQRIAEI